MKTNINNLPDKVDDLKGIIIKQYKQEQKYKSVIKILKEQINILKATIFGSSAEKVEE